MELLVKKYKQILIHTLLVLMGGLEISKNFFFLRWCC